MRRLLLLSLLLVCPAARAQTDAELKSLAERFAATLSLHDLRAFDALAATPPAEGKDWAAVAEAIEVRRCAEVQAAAWKIDTPGPEPLVQVDVEGYGVMRGGPPVTRRFRAPFMLRLVRTPATNGKGTWKIRSVERAERTVALRMGAVATDAERDAILLQHTDLPDPGYLARTIADEATEVRSPLAARLDLVEYALALTLRYRDLRAEARVRHLRSIALEMNGRVEEGHAAMREAVEVARREGSATSIGSVLFGHAMTLPDPVPALREAVGFIHEMEDPRPALRVQTVITNIVSNRGNLGEFMTEVEKLDRLSKQYAWREGELNAAIFLAGMQITLRNYEVAQLQYEKVYAHAVAARNDLTATIALHLIADLQWTLGRNKEAVETLRRALRKADEFLIPLQRAQSRGMLAELLIELRQHEEAERLLREGIALSKEAVPAMNALLAKLRLAQGRHTEALAAARATIAPHEGRQGDPEQLIGARGVAARALRALKRDDEALNELETTVALIDSRVDTLPADELTRARFFDALIAPYRDLAELLVDRGRARDALLVAERMRARVLRESVQSGRVDLSASMSEEEKAREDALDQKVVELNRKIEALPERDAGRAALKTQLDAARAELHGFLSELYVRHPALRLRRGEPAETLDVGSAGAAIEFVVAEHRTIVFAVDGGNVTAHVIPIEQVKLEQRVESFVAALSRRDLGYRKAAQEMYDLLVAPVAAHLPKERPLCIVPDGALWRVPFQALRTPGGKHLVEERPLFYAASLSMLAASAPREAARERTLLAFGNPRADVHALPDAEREVNTLAELYGKERSRVYTGKEARETTFKSEAGAYRVLHVATHGTLDDRAPMYSALVFATDDGQEDGLLEAREIVQLRLDADLAVLSACDTARGGTGGGEGVIGLSWAFHVAGCPTTVTSQWKADSAATARLMISFHQSLLTGHSPAAALRDAQRALMKESRYAHPLYWAAFSVMGEGQ